MVLRQPPQSLVQEPGRRGLGSRGAGVELDRQHPVALRPGHQLGPVAEPALVVEGGSLLLAAVDIGAGGVDVEGHWCGGIEPHLGVEAVAGLGGGGQGRPQLGHREPAQQLPGGGRRRSVRHHPQRRPGRILAQDVEMGKVIAPGHHGLG
jgi:hypothetical protein